MSTYAATLPRALVRSFPRERSAEWLLGVAGHGAEAATSIEPKSGQHVVTFEARHFAGDARVEWAATEGAPWFTVTEWFVRAPDGQKAVGGKVEPNINLAGGYKDSLTLTVDLVV